ncbi:MAG: hypothetical protein R2831_13420 [Chitinophagaceae bacterium]
MSDSVASFSPWALINRVSTTLVDILLWPLQSFPVWLQLTWMAALLAAFALLVFKYFSSQSGIRQAKDRVKAYLLELWLYKDDPAVQLRAQGKAIWHSLRYLVLSLPPLLVMSLPMLLLLFQVEARFGWRGLEPGESTILTATLADSNKGNISLGKIAPQLEVGAGLTVETPALRLLSERKVLWRLRATDVGVHPVQVAIGAATASRSIVAGQALSPLAPDIYRANDWRELGFPGESPLPADAAIASLSVDYPYRDGDFLGLSQASWILLGLSLLFGFLLRGPMRVDF